MFVGAVALGLALAAVPGGTSYEPPRLIKGERPEVPVQAVGGALVLLDVGVDSDGSVDGVRTLASVSPYTEALRDAAARFRFRAAREDDEPLSARVLVAGYFRPPALTVTGPVLAPRDMPQPQVALPTEIVPPAYPPNAQGDATVIVDVRLDPQGHVVSAGVIETAAGFDDAAVAAARAWRFEVPDLTGARPASAVLVFVFRAPADIGRAPR
jgi:TonB family protein